MPEVPPEGRKGIGGIKVNLGLNTLKILGESVKYIAVIVAAVAASWVWVGQQIVDHEELDAATSQLSEEHGELLDERTENVQLAFQLAIEELRNDHAERLEQHDLGLESIVELRCDLTRFSMEYWENLYEEILQVEIRSRRTTRVDGEIDIGEYDGEEVIVDSEMDAAILASNARRAQRVLKNLDRGQDFLDDHCI